MNKLAKEYGIGKRDISTKLWDTELNDWATDHVWYIKSGDDPLSDWICFEDHFASEDTGNIVFNDPMPRGRFIEVQYTGLKDKNGKEIYEGDIVRYLDMNFVVNSYAEHHMGWQYGQDLFSRSVADSCKVIGNIFQHEHLLSE